MKHPQSLYPVVMVAEDDEDTRQMLRTMLEMRGCSVIEARNGQEAVHLALEKRPYLVFLDLQLPLLNGFAVTRFMRQQQELKNVSIIIVSGHDPRQHRSLALAAGCNDYLYKPVDFEKIEKILRDHLAPI